MLKFPERPRTLSVLVKEIPRQQRAVRLSIVTQFYPPDYAATGQLIEELAQNLRQQGMHVQIFTGQPGYAFSKDYAPPREHVNGVLIRRSRISRIWPQRIRGKAVSGLLFCLRSALHLLKTSCHGDVLLLTTAPPYLPVLGYFASLIYGVPYVCVLYDLYPDVAVQLRVISPKHWLTRLWNFINHQTWKRAQQIVVLSPSVKEHISRKFPDLREKIVVIHSWADPQRIVPLAKQENWFAHRYQLVNKFTVLYSGNLGRCHDLDTIMDAIAQLQQKSVQFVFIGGGAQRESCEAIAREQNFSNCLFLDYQEKQTLPYSLTACDLALVSVSRGMEALIVPSKLYGILASGRPVAIVCEPHSYLRQLIAEAKCGRAFDNSDSDGLAEFICELARDPALAQAMGKAGRDYLETHFTPEIIAQQYSEILSSEIVQQHSK